MDVGALLEGAAVLTGVVGSGMAGAKALKVHGKRRQHNGRAGHHQVSSPVAAVSLPALILAILPVLGYDLQPVCEVVTRACSNPAALGASVGTVGVALHSVIRGWQKLQAPG